MGFKKVTLLGPLIFLVHGLEEVLNEENGMKKNKSAIDKLELARSLIKSEGYTTAHFLFYNGK